MRASISPTKRAMRATIRAGDSSASTWLPPGSRSSRTPGSADATSSAMRSAGRPRRRAGEEQRRRDDAPAGVERELVVGRERVEVRGDRAPCATRPTRARRARAVATRRRRPSRRRSAAPRRRRGPCAPACAARAPSRGSRPPDGADRSGRTACGTRPARRATSERTCARAAARDPERDGRAVRMADQVHAVRRRGDQSRDELGVGGDDRRGRRGHRRAVAVAVQVRRDARGACRSSAAASARHCRPLAPLECSATTVGGAWSIRDVMSLSRFSRGERSGRYSGSRASTSNRSAAPRLRRDDRNASCSSGRRRPPPAADALRAPAAAAAATARAPSRRGPARRPATSSGTRARLVGAVQRQAHVGHALERRAGRRSRRASARCA